MAPLFPGGIKNMTLQTCPFPKPLFKIDIYSPKPEIVKKPKIKDCEKKRNCDKQGCESHKKIHNYG